MPRSDPWRDRAVLAEKKLSVLGRTAAFCTRAPALSRAVAGRFQPILASGAPRARSFAYGAHTTHTANAPRAYAANLDTFITNQLSMLAVDVAPLHPRPYPVYGA